MANVAQLINTIHSLFLAYEDKFIATPNFHVFEMYAAHQGGQSLRTLFSAAPVSYKRTPPNVPPAALAQMSPQQRALVAGQAASTEGTLWGLQGSASLNGKKLTLTVVNPHATEVTEAEIVLRGASIQSGQATTLTSTDIHAHNSFDNPQALQPTSADIRPLNGSLIHRFPAASVTRLQLDVG